MLGPGIGLSRSGGIIIKERGPGVTGQLVMWPTPTPPLGWVLCDGRSLSTTLYSDLFALIGYTFGGTGGSFNVPNFTDQTPQGASATDAIGAYVGKKMQTSIPQHRHELVGHDAATGGNYVTFTTPYNLVGRYTEYTGTAGGVDQRGPRLAIYFIIKD